jgi:excinuclease ABC subunit B
MFTLESSFSPSGDQRGAIDKLVGGIAAGKSAQVLLGITGSGKTYTVANVIASVQKPTLVVAHNKTLAAQLYHEFKTFFPSNAVEYFVSYYDYYQPEAYIARTDTYIEKDMAINDHIDRLRLSATRSLFERDDVIIVASVSCIYGLGMPEHYASMNLTLNVGGTYRYDELFIHLVEMHYKRNDIDFRRGTFRVRGDVLEIFPAYEEDVAWRIEFFGDDIERISVTDPLTGKVLERVETMTLYPGSHHVTPEAVREEAYRDILAELEERKKYFEKENDAVALQRIHQRTMHDLEMIREVGFCKGIENYSRHFGRRDTGTAPACLIDYFPDDFLLIVDESHQTVPQIRAMYHGDRSRKQSLVDFGFRLPSAYDNRPLTFEEAYRYFNKAIYVSATPGEWEVADADGGIAEQVIRPTGLLDPIIDVRPATHQVDDVLEEIQQAIEAGDRVLVTVLTKHLAEEVTKYLEEIGVKACYLHSGVVTLERMQIIQKLRKGEYDVIVGVNLLREGLDIPEVALVAILDADREGFLRSETSLIQTCGRAARNVRGRVIMYADKMTAAIRSAVRVTEERRQRQQEYNEEHGIVPRSVKREVEAVFDVADKESAEGEAGAAREAEVLTPEMVERRIKEHKAAMKAAAAELRFMDAAQHRDKMRYYEEIALSFF